MKYSEDINANTLETGLKLVYLVRPAIEVSEKRKVLILLHGVGSNEQDLISLAPYLPDDMTVISPRGPFVLGEGRYAWYEVAFSSGKPTINAEQEEQSRALIREFIAQVKDRYRTDDVYLGGFSQGAIMSFTTGLLYPELVSGILAFSGRILQEIKPLVSPPEKLQHLKVFIAHGTQDNTLPVHYAREAKDLLACLGIAPTYHEQAMGHQITSEVIAAVLDWLS